MMRPIGVWFFVIGFCLATGGTQTAAGQTAKFDAQGNLTWIGGLLTDSTGCEASRTFTGKISKAETLAGDHADGYEFVLKMASGKQQKFQTSLSHDEGAILADFEELLQRNRRVKVKARRCGSGGFWTAEEVWRI